MSHLNHPFRSFVAGNSSSPGEAGFLQGREMVTQQLAGHAGENPSLTKTCTSADEIRQYIGENQKQLKEIAFNEDKKRKVPGGRSSAQDLEA